MSVEKLSISVESSIAAQARNTAAAAGSSLSAWISEAIEARLRLEGLGAAIRDWEETFGPIPAEAIEAVRRERASWED